MSTKTEVTLPVVIDQRLRDHAAKLGGVHDVLVDLNAGACHALAKLDLLLHRVCTRLHPSIADDIRAAQHELRIAILDANGIEMLEELESRMYRDAHTPLDGAKAAKR